MIRFSFQKKKNLVTKYFLEIVVIRILVLEITEILVIRILVIEITNLKKFEMLLL
jgi:hypothetical protein